MKLQFSAWVVGFSGLGVLARIRCRRPFDSPAGNLVLGPFQQASRKTGQQHFCRVELINAAEMLLSGGIVAAGALSIASSVFMLRSPRKRGTEVDIDALVRDAPYHRLQKISFQRSEPLDEPGMADLP